MKKILIVIDAQSDFINGVLGSKEAIIAKDNICDLIKNSNYETIYFTQDIHENDTYLSTQEGRYLPIKHCIRNTPGAAINSKILLNVNESTKIFPIRKSTFGTLALKNILDPANIESIDIVGFCTDICVITNVLIIKTLCPETEINVIEKCCAGSTLEKHNAVIKIMESCQVNII